MGGDETLKLVLVYVAWLLLSKCHNVCNLASPHLMDLRGLRVTKNAYLSLFTHTKQLLLAILCDMIELQESETLKWDETPTPLMLPMP